MDATPQKSLDLRQGALLLPVVAGAFVASLSAPLLTYTLSLALFGLTHVATELRYVALRFSHRLAQKIRWMIMGLLTGVALLRLLMLGGFLPTHLGQTLEVFLVFVLGITGLSFVQSHQSVRSMLAWAFCLLLLAGFLSSPTYTLLLLAIAHNWTPIGFLTEASRGRQRQMLLTACVIVFLVLPSLIATGLPSHFLSRLGLYWPETTLLPAGPLATHFSVYLPRVFHESVWATHAFSAIVFAQCMHYVAVIHVMPTFVPPSTRKFRRWFLGITIAASCALLVVFFFNFTRARGIYGIFAAIHAWLEVPILLLALVASRKKSQASQELLRFPSFVRRG